ncbi:hypothetical protein GURASL_08750 [Geotalea uraniireducens]|uniref:SPOR domain-containing protein n=1 Tax=Geotalea uraniireducens TaxID=351604 RepID=A0ABM8EHP5_9BACT|nr:SPOR domain-containing protein [Geotalea uraniireducens]BDV41952.1 hypothetical protein GURASL_08750 [Geotalea uraniireducens]
MLFRQWKSFLLASCVHFLLTASLSSAAQIKGNKETNGYSVNVGAFAEEKNAERLAAKLQAKGIDAIYFKKDNGVYTVRFGEFATLDAARNVAKKLVDDKLIGSYFIVSSDTHPKKTIPQSQSTKKNGWVDELVQVQRSMQKTDADRQAELSLLKSKAKNMKEFFDKTKSAPSKFTSKCGVSNDSQHPAVVCTLFFPDVGPNMRYYHNIDAFVHRATAILAKDGNFSFFIDALVGGFVAYKYSYTKEFDQIDRVSTMPY